MRSEALYASMHMAQQSDSASFSSVLLPVFVGIFIMAFLVTEQRWRCTTEEIGQDVIFHIQSNKYSRTVDLWTACI